MTGQGIPIGMARRAGDRPCYRGEFGIHNRAKERGVSRSRAGFSVGTKSTLVVESCMAARAGSGRVREHVDRVRGESMFSYTGPTLEHGLGCTVGKIAAGFVLGRAGAPARS